MNLDKLILDFHQDSINLAKENRGSEVIWATEYISVFALNSLGLAYATYENNYKKALETLYNALKIEPASSMVWSNITHVYSTIGQNDNAIEAALKAVECSDGKDFHSFYNAGVVLTNGGRLQEAEQMYRSARILSPNNENVSFNLSLSLLRQGKYEEGFQLYEYRFKTSEYTGNFKKRFLQDEWDGRKFKKKSLLIYSEQGLGDFIQFGRFIKNIRPFGGKIICEVQEPLAKIVKENFDVDEVISRPNNSDWPQAPESDYCISICSLPRVLKIKGIEEVSSDPYIKTKTVYKLKNTGKKFKIGICWAGNPDHKRDCTRSIPVSNFSVLTQNKNIQCYSLMKGVNSKRTWPTGAVDLNDGIEKLNIIDLQDKINDFNDLAGIVKSMDLVITVDTALAHLCGSMGIPTWVLIGMETDWRWMDNINKTLWYDSVTLFRYKDGWENLLNEVVDALPINQKVK